MAKSVLRRRARVLVAAAAATIALAAVPASATPLRFTFTGGTVGSFELDSNPVPVASAAGQFVVLAPTNRTGAFASSASYAFFSTAGQTLSGQPIAFTDGVSVLLAGPPLFSGAEAAPIFNTGSFTLTNLSASLVDLVVTVGGPGVPAPELGASWAAALAAALALAATRRRQAVPAA